jgi:polysaccharide deacetylase family protein (PEP-CTERM system associated)
VGGSGNGTGDGETLHHFTVDVEEYFQVSAFERYVSRHEWPLLETRVAVGVGRLLDLLARHGSRATFFVLGCVAERHPDLVRTIASAGHEIASHGWGHRRVTALSPDAFRHSVRRSKQLLEDAAAMPVLGFRAPSFSIVPGLEWALRILVEEGYRYDSSLFPVRRPGYGYRNGARDPHRLTTPAGDLLEFPPATFRWLGANVPAAGGAYLRLLPLALVRAAVRQAERRGAAATLYVHPWEVDPQQPRLAVPMLARVRHYGGLRRTLPRLERLLSEFRFRPVRDRVAAVAAAP